MLARIEQTLERFRIHFDSWARQSELEQRLPELLPRLDTYERDTMGVKLAGRGYRTRVIVGVARRVESGFRSGAPR